MRVVAGQARGRRLKVPVGKRLRPTGERVKEALFSIVSSRFDLNGIAVLDLFAGTGALGIEALSRGAGLAVFVERGRKTSSLISTNLEKAGFSDSGVVLTGEVDSMIAKLCREGRHFGLVLADPPYDRSLVGRVLKQLGRSGLLEDGGLIVVEHSTRETPAESYGALAVVDRRRYGDSCLTFFEKVVPLSQGEGERSVDDG